MWCSTIWAIIVCQSKTRFLKAGLMLVKFLLLCSLRLQVYSLTVAVACEKNSEDPPGIMASWISESFPCMVKFNKRTWNNGEMTCSKKLGARKEWKRFVGVNYKFSPYILMVATIYSLNFNTFKLSQKLWIVVPTDNNVDKMIIWHAYWPHVG